MVGNLIYVLPFVCSFNKVNKKQLKDKPYTSSHSLSLPLTHSLIHIHTKKKNLQQKFKISAAIFLWEGNLAKGKVKYIKV